MLQSIREKITGWVAGAIIALIAVTFVFWGVGDFGAGGRDAVAIVNGDEISRRDFEQVYQRQLFELTQAYDGAVPEALRRELRQRVIESLVRERLLAQRVEQRGYRIPDEVLTESIESIEAFRIGERFSLDAYRARISAQGLTPTMFEQRQRQALALDQLQQAIAATGFFTPTEFRRYIELAHQRRELAWASFPIDEFIEQIEPIEPQRIVAYYQENTREFMRPERVDLEYVELTLAGISADMPVDEQTLRDYYERTVVQYASPEQRRARHILITADDQRDLASARALAQSLRERIDAGEDFGALAAEYSVDEASAANGGDLGWAQRGEFVEAFERVLFTLKPGEVSAPVETVFGFHIIRVEEVREGETPAFEDIRDELREEFLRTEAENRFIDQANALADAAFEYPDDLTTIAESLGLALERLPGFTREGSMLFADSTPVVEAAFSPEVMHDGAVSSLVQVDDEHVLLLRVIEHHPAEPLDFQQVADDIRGRLERQAATALALEIAGRFVARLQEEADPEALREEFGRALTEPGLYSRQEFNGVPPGLLFEAFQRRRPAPGDRLVDHVTLDNGDVAVFVLSDVRAGDPGEVEQRLRDIEKNRLAMQAGFQDFALYLEALAASARVRRRAEALDETF